MTIHHKSLMSHISLYIDYMVTKRILYIKNLYQEYNRNGKSFHGHIY